MGDNIRSENGKLVGYDKNTIDDKTKFELFCEVFGERLGLLDSRYVDMKSNIERFENRVENDMGDLKGQINRVLGAMETQTMVYKENLATWRDTKNQIGAFKEIMDTTERPKFLLKPKEIETAVNMSRAITAGWWFFIKFSAIVGTLSVIAGLLFAFFGGK